MGCAIVVTFHGNRGHGDDRTREKFVFEIVVLRLAFGQALPPTIIMDRDVDVVWVLEGSRAAIKRGVIEVPRRRSELPNQLCEIVRVFLVAEPTAFRGEIKLVPPRELSFRRQRLEVRLDTADQITADGNEGLAALGPERRDDGGRPCTPVITSNDGPLDLQ